MSAPKDRSEARQSDAREDASMRFERASPKTDGYTTPSFSDPLSNVHRGDGASPLWPPRLSFAVGRGGGLSATRGALGAPLLRAKGQAA
jgi:hypothetical protein